MVGNIYNTVTQLFALVGIMANVTLLLLIRTRTPSYMKTYAYLLMSSACGDLVGLLCLVATLPREVIYEQFLVVQFQGVCAAVSEEACWHAFGVLQWMFSTTCALLAASFALRLAILSSYNVVYGGIILVVAVFVPTAWLFVNVYRIGSPHSREPLLAARFVTNDTQLGIIDQTDGFTQFTLNSTILISMLLFILSIVLRSVILRKLHAVQFKMSAQSRQCHFMLIRALNVQLPVTSFFFSATIFYVLNASGILVGDYVDYWTTPFANLQNVLTPMVNLWFIQPYRKSIRDVFKCKRTANVQPTERTETSAYTSITPVA